MVLQSNLDVALVRIRVETFIRIMKQKSPVLPSNLPFNTLGILDYMVFASFYAAQIWIPHYFLIFIIICFSFTCLLFGFFSILVVFNRSWSQNVSMIVSFAEGLIFTTQNIWESLSS